MPTITRRRKVSLADEGEIPGAKPRPASGGRKPPDAAAVANGHQANSHGRSAVAADVSKSIQRREAAQFAREQEEEAAAALACTRCGCTEREPCEGDAGACGWATTQPPVCSECVDAAVLAKADIDATVADFMAEATDDDVSLLKELAEGPPYRDLTRDELCNWDMGEFSVDEKITYRVRRNGLAVNVFYGERKGIVLWESVAIVAGLLHGDPPANGKPKKGKRPNDGLGSATPDAIARNDPDAVAINGHPLPGRNGKRKKGKPQAAAPLGTGFLTDLDPGSIDPSPYQARTEFPIEELRELAASIQQHGLLQAIVVRAAGQRYELIAGERRLRAVMLAGLGTVRAGIVQMTDAQAAEAVLVENLQRKDLNAIEEAKGFQRLLQVRGGTQEELAGSLGVTQGHVSNRLRLLEAPAAWQARVISGEMPASHLRAVLPWLGYPTLAKNLEQEWKGVCERYEETPTVSCWEQVASARIFRETKPLRALSEWDAKIGQRLEVRIEPTEAQRKQLQLVTVRDSQWDGGKHVDFDAERALNAKAWKPLWDDALAAARARHKVQAEKREKKGTAKAKKLTPRDAKRMAEQKAAQLAARIEAWRFDWLRMLVAPRLNFSREARVAHKLELWLMLHGDNWKAARQGVMAVAVGESFDYADELWQKLVACQDASQIHDWQLAFLRGLLWNAEKAEAVNLIFDEIVEDLARELEIDLAACWGEKGKDGQNYAGPLTRRLYELHDRPQLEALAEELGVGVHNAKTKEDVIRCLLGASGAGKHLKLPRCIEPLKAKNKPAKKTGAKKG